MRRTKVERRVRARAEGRKWVVFICAEPDGEDCDSGTHPGICSHKCAAVRRFHDEKGPAPVIVGVEVAPVEDDLQAAPNISQPNTGGERCPVCKGTGINPQMQMLTCPKCNGEKTVPEKKWGSA